jgi:hypothetical protein
MPPSLVPAAGELSASVTSMTRQPGSGFGGSVAGPASQPASAVASVACAWAALISRAMAARTFALVTSR